MSARFLAAHRGWLPVSRKSFLTKRFYLIGLTVLILSVVSGNRIATMQDAENSSAPPVAAPAAGAQLQPQIAKGANSSLAVWTDQRTVLGRYVPTDSAGTGGETDIYAARYDAAGNLIDTTPIIVSQAVYEQFYPRVAWNGQNWLVVWVTRSVSNPNVQNVVGARVSPEGRVLDAAPVAFSNTTNSSDNPTYLSVTSDGANWAVIWGKGSYGSQINGTRLSPEGALMDATPKILYNDTNFTAPFWADIAYSNNQFLVVWEIISGNGHAIRARRFDANLNPIGSLFTVSFSGGDATSARVASDGANYLVIWRENRFAYNEIFAARVTSDGTVSDPAGIKLYGGPGDYVLPFNTALTFDGTSYIAAYHGGDSGVTGKIFANRITLNGTASAPIPIPAPNGSSQPAVGALADGGAQILWTDKSLSPDGDIFGAKLAADNTVGARMPTSLGAPRETRPRFTKTGTGNYALVYRSTISGESSVFLQRFDAGGNPIGANPTLIISGSEDITNPSVAWNGAVYLVVWELGAQIFGRRVAADGAPLGEAFAVMPGNTPDVAALGSQFLVVDTYEPTNHIRFAQAVRVDGSGTVQGAPVRIGNNFDLRPRVRAFGSRWLVVWESDISHDNPNSSITAAFVNADGTAATGEIGVGSFGDAPDFAVAGNTALIVWMDGGNIIGRRMLADGTFAAGSSVIADTQSPLFAPKAAWDGARFVVAYGDPRNRATLPPADIYATLVTLDGAIITPGGFPVAASSLSEEMPAVEAHNGTTVFGFAKFEDRAPFAAFRIKLRRFPFDRDFNVSITPFSRTIAPGETTTFTVHVNAQNNFNQEVILSADGLPNGVTATFNPPTITNGNGTSVLTLTTGAGTPEGIYRFTISATSGAQQSTADAVLYLDDSPPPTTFAVTNLGTLGGTQSEARAINDSGQIVGYAFNSGQQKRAFLYTNGAMQDLGTFGGTESVAYDINNAGQVVGWAKNAAGREQAFLYSGGALQNLGTLGGQRSYAFGINNNGQITGSAEIDTGLNHAFLYQNGAMQDLGVLNGNYSYGREINSAGKIVGLGYQDGQNGGPRAVIYQNGAFASLGTLGGSDSNANAINDSDQIVGSSSYTTENGTQHAFLYQNGAMQDLGTLGAAQSYAYDINNSGKVVGSLRLTLFGSDYRAFIYEGGVMRNLNTMISQNSGWVLNEAFGINNNGQIVGRGTFNDQSRAFLLNPVGAQNQPPSVQITSPAANQNLPESSALTINASALDADGAVVKVEFYADGNLIGTSTSQPFAILWTGMQPNRTYTLTAKAFDDAGAATVSAPVTITVGTAANARTRFDFDGDGKADVSVYRSGTWYIQQSTAGFTGAQFGIASDKIVPADYDGDGKTDLGVYRDGTWYLLRSTAGFTAIQFGLASDIPQTGDFDGDSKSDLAVFRPTDGTWYLLRSRDGFTGVQFGQNGDKPVAADFDGDAKTDMAVYRGGVWYVLQSRDGFRAVQFGIASDKPVVADYDGDGKADFAVYREGVWYLQRSQAGFTAVQFGISTDVPVPADYDGDGKADLGVYRDGTWYLQRSAGGFTGLQFGLAGDVPVPSAYLP